jgi:hypothetical protein
VLGPHASQIFERLLTLIQNKACHSSSAQEEAAVPEKKERQKEAFPLAGLAEEDGRRLPVAVPALPLPLLLLPGATAASALETPRLAVGVVAAVVLAAPEETPPL